MRGGLLKLGLKPGDRIAILAENCPQWVITDLAVLGMGAVVVPLYPTSSADEIEHVLSDSGTRAIALRGSENLEKIVALVSRLPGLQALIAIGQRFAATAVDTPRPIVTSLRSLDASPEAQLTEVIHSDVATIIYTSGTTGASKGVVLTHGNLLANCEASKAALDLNEQDVILSFLPIAHSFERTAGYYTVLTAGGTIAYAEGLGQIAQNLLEDQPDIVVLTVPRLLEVIHTRVLRTVEKSSPIRRRLFALALATGQRAANYRFRGRSVPPHLAVRDGAVSQPSSLRVSPGLFGKRLRYLISGGAPLPREIFEFFSAAEIPIVEGYGLTEASPVVAVNLHGQTRPGTVGRPLNGVRVKLAADGELLVHGAKCDEGLLQAGGGHPPGDEPRRLAAHRRYRGNRRRRIHRHP